jgi:hypothetical protein
LCALPVVPATSRRIEVLGLAEPARGP